MLTWFSVEYELFHTTPLDPAPPTNPVPPNNPAPRNAGSFEEVLTAGTRYGEGRSMVELDSATAVAPAADRGEQQR